MKAAVGRDEVRDPARIEGGERSRNHGRPTTRKSTGIAKRERIARRRPTKSLSSTGRHLHRERPGRNHRRPRTVSAIEAWILDARHQDACARSGQGGQSGGRGRAHEDDRAPKVAERSAVPRTTSLASISTESHERPVRIMRPGAAKPSTGTSGGRKHLPARSRCGRRRPEPRFRRPRRQRHAAHHVVEVRRRVHTPTPAAASANRASGATVPSVENESPPWAVTWSSIGRSPPRANAAASSSSPISAFALRKIDVVADGGDPAAPRLRMRPRGRHGGTAIRQAR